MAWYRYIKRVIAQKNERRANDDSSFQDGELKSEKNRIRQDVEITQESEGNNNQILGQVKNSRVFHHVEGDIVYHEASLTTYIDQWIDNLKEHKLVSGLMLTVIILLAFSGAIDATRNIATMASNILHLYTTELRILKTVVREDIPETEQGNLKWHNLVDLTLQNNSDDPIFIDSAIVNVKKIWQVKPTQRLAGGVSISQTYDFVLPVRATPYQKVSNDVYFEVRSKSTDRLAIEVKLEDEEWPYIFLISISLSDKSNEEIVESEDILILQQGQTNLVLLEEPLTINEIPFFYIYEATKNVCENKIVVDDLEKIAAAKGSNLESFITSINQTQLPLYQFVQSDSFSISRSFGVNEGLIIDFASTPKNLPGVNPESSSYFRFSSGIRKLRPGEIDTFATGWSYDELIQEYEKADQQAFKIQAKEDFESKSTCQ